MQQSIYRQVGTYNKELNSPIDHFLTAIQTKTISQIREFLHQALLKSGDINIGKILCQHLNSVIQTYPSIHHIYLINQMIHHRPLTIIIQPYLIHFYITIFKKAFSIKDYAMIEEMKKYRKYWVTKIDYSIYSQMKNIISYKYRFDIDIFPIRVVQELFYYYRDMVKMNQKDIEFHLQQSKQMRSFDRRDRDGQYRIMKRERSYEIQDEQLKSKKSKPNNWRFNILQKDSEQQSTLSTQIQSCDICYEKHCKVDLSDIKWIKYGSKRQTDIDEQLKYSSRLFNYRCSECDQIFLLKQSYQWHRHKRIHNTSICTYRKPEEWQILIKKEQVDNFVLISNEQSFVTNCCYFCNQQFQLSFLQYYIIKNAIKTNYRSNSVIIHPKCQQKLKEMEVQYEEMLRQAAQDIN